MGSFGENWDDNWTEIVSSQAVSDGSDYTSGSQSMDGKTGALVAVQIDYGATVDEGAMVFILKDAAGTDESENDNPWGFEMPSAVSSTRRKVFAIDARSCDDFKIRVSNETGAQITAHLDIKFREGVTA